MSRRWSRWASVWLNLFLCFFFNDTATTEIYTLSLHDALPISAHGLEAAAANVVEVYVGYLRRKLDRSEEHTSELQSLTNLVCRLLLEQKKAPRNAARRRDGCWRRRYRHEAHALHALLGRVAVSVLFFFNDTATTEIYTLSLHDALPISGSSSREGRSLPGLAQCTARP